MSRFNSIFISLNFMVLMVPFTLQRTSFFKLFFFNSVCYTDNPLAASISAITPVFVGFSFH